MIVTIARECECFGNDIGTLLAQELGVPLYDKEKITSLAREKGIYEKYTNFFEEKQENLLFSAIAEEEQLDEVRRTPRCALHEVVGDNSCVIIGRCGNYAYAGEKELLRVFLCGNKEDRIARLMEKHQVPRREAVITIDKTENRRRAYHKFYTGQEWGYAGNYDLCINDSNMGVEGTIEMIMCELQYKR